MNDHPMMRSRLVIGLLLLAATPSWSAVYEVGDGMSYANVNDVPWESIGAGDTVLIHYRAAPYREKWVIAGLGTEADPVIVRGVPGPDGQLPVIDGENATTRLQLDYWNENRSVVKVGGSSVPPDVRPQYVVIESLDIRGARPPNTFTDDSGNQQSYRSNAAAIHVERGAHVTIRGCTLRDSGNGLFVSSSAAEAAEDILVDGNHIHSNGNVGSIYEHNVYTAAIGITFDGNRFGSLQSGAGGNNLKDRSAGLVVRYNWLEGGNRQLDLVDAEDSPLIRDHPSYGATYVYGNVLIEPAGEGNKQIAHYGGDSGSTTWYRKGTLHFYHNTLVSLRTDGTTLLRLSTNDEHCDARNNVLYAVAGGSSLAMLDATGVLDLSHNWLEPGWHASFGTLQGVINDDGSSIAGTSPGFVEPAGQDYRLLPGSDGVDAAADLHPAVVPAQAVGRQYVRHQTTTARPVTGGAADVGAFEFLPGDADGDGWVAAGDYAAFAPCLLGPAVPVAGGCGLFDLDLSGAVDLADFRGFQAVFTGE